VKENNRNFRNTLIVEVKNSEWITYLLDQHVLKLSWFLLCVRAHSKHEMPRLLRQIILLEIMGALTDIDIHAQSRLSLLGHPVLLDWWLVLYCSSCCGVHKEV
jgi:hypothetical protein